MAVTIGYEQNFKAGLYVRLSREDEDKQNINDFSESIKNQKEFLSEFATKNGYSIVDIYADDGISGTTFDREDFNRMLNDIEILYKDKVKEIITEEQFLELLEETNKEKEKYIIQMQQINKKIEESEEQVQQ